MVVSALFLLALGTARGDLTGRLVDDSDTMANIVGASETQSLVDFKLHKEQAVRDTVAEDTASVKARAKATYMALLAAQKEEADANNLKRHLREQLEILTAEDEEKKGVAVKADAIAKRMAAMAARADGAWQEVSKAKDKTEVGFKEAQATAKATAESETRAAKARREAEDQAQVASSKLAVADKQVRLLLEKHQKLEDMKMAEDQRQTTRLADAFKQDALRQSAFKTAMLSARAAEKNQQMITLARRQRQDKAADDVVSAQKSSLTFKRQASISQLQALEHSLLRANPELDALRSRGGGGDDLATGDASSGQTLVGNFGDHTVQNADKARWEQLAQVVGHVSTQGDANDEDDFTVPASDSPRI